MKKIIILIGLFAISAIGVFWYPSSQKPASEPVKQPSAGKQQSSSSNMSFFITSVNPGKGADFGGVAGADQYCQSLAKEGGAENKTWRAYLSTQATDNSPAINARDRIGSGPWKNFQGVVIAGSIEDLHANNNINKQTGLSEEGEIINGRGDTPNRHDILTGSTPEGLAFGPGADNTCGNWTSSKDGAAMVGHHDRQGLADDAPSKSWNSSHLSRGCSLEGLATTGSGGLIYCFATTE